jgi:putative cardiolipin synthase
VDVLEWVTVTLFSDDPAKGQGRHDRDDLLIARLNTVLSEPVESLDLVSAYLIPGRQGTDLLESYLAAGVATRIVTNSLEATDVPVVHSGWMRYRDRLVRQGADVLELRARPDRAPESSLAQILTGSQSSLHAKTFAVDGKRIFIGSFNFDPRSALLNTEMGFLIDSPTIAGALSRSLDGAESFYRVVLAEDGALNWIETREDGTTIRHAREPNSSAFERVMLRVMGWLPFEWML